MDDSLVIDLPKNGIGKTFGNNVVIIHVGGLCILKPSN